MAMHPTSPIAEQTAAKTAELHHLLQQLPPERLQEVVTFVNFLLYKENTKANATPKPVTRTPGLGRGTIWISDDFDEPLPDDFWFSPTDPLLQNEPVSEVAT